MTTRQSYSDYVAANIQEKVLNEKLNPNFKGFFMNGINVKFTNHSLERHNERTDAMHENDWKIILSRVAEKIKGLSKGYYLFFSKQYQQGIVLFWDNPIIYIITILPKGRKNTKDDTRLLMIESAKQAIHESIFFGEGYSANLSIMDIE